MVFRVGMRRLVALKPRSGLRKTSIADGTLIDNFSNIAGWAIGGPGGSKAADTASYFDAPQSIKVSAINGTTITKTLDVQVPFAAGDVFVIWINIRNALNVSTLRLYLAEDAGFTKYWFVIRQAIGSLREGPQAIVIAASEFTNVGATLGNTIVQARLRADCYGPVDISFDAFYRNRKQDISNIVVQFDDGHATQYSEAYPYMLARSVPGTLSIISGLVDTAGIMTLAQIQEMHSSGWDCVNHVDTNKSFNGANDATLSGAIANSQTPTTAFTLNGGMTSGGVATLDTPRHLVFRSSTSEGGKVFSITGTLSGVGQTEDVSAPNSGWSASSKLWSTVTGITISSAAAGTISVGASQSPAEITAAIEACETYLSAKGLNRAGKIIAYPNGEYNDSAISILWSMGYKEARTTFSATNSVVFGRLNTLRTSAFSPSNTTTQAAMLAEIDKAIERKSDHRIVFHKIVASPATIIEASITDFRAVIDYLVTKRDAGLVRLLTASQWIQASP